MFTRTKKPSNFNKGLTQKIIYELIKRIREYTRTEGPLNYLWQTYDRIAKGKGIISSPKTNHTETNPYASPSSCPLNPNASRF